MKVLENTLFNFISLNKNQNNAVSDPKFNTFRLPKISSVMNNRQWHPLSTSFYSLSKLSINKLLID